MLKLPWSRDETMVPVKCHACVAEAIGTVVSSRDHGAYKQI